MRLDGPPAPAAGRRAAVHRLAQGGPGPPSRRSAGCRLRVRNGARQRLARDEPRRPGAVVKPLSPKLPPLRLATDSARSTGETCCGAGRRAFHAEHRQFFFTADGAHVPLQARRSRARRLRLCAAAGAARTCVARLQPPRPLTRWPSPRRRGPRSPCDDLCGPAECPTSVRSSMPTTTYAQNQHLPLIRWRPGQARWTRAEQHDQNTPSPRCSAPRSVSRSRYTVVSSQFWPRSSRIGFMSQGKGTEPSCAAAPAACRFCCSRRGIGWRKLWRAGAVQRCRMT